jgi:hypothetical protein
MELSVVRNKKQVLELCNKLMERRLPFRLLIDDIYPVRSVDMNAYYWGVVLKYISEESGHTVEECHEIYKEKFNLGIEFMINKHKGIPEPVFGIGSTASMNSKAFNDYVFRVRVDGEMEHGIVIPLPSESFIPELEFEHDKIQNKKL